MSVVTCTVRLVMATEQLVESNPVCYHTRDHKPTLDDSKSQVTIFPRILVKDAGLDKNQNLMCRFLFGQLALHVNTVLA